MVVRRYKPVLSLMAGIFLLILSLTSYAAAQPEDVLKYSLDNVLQSWVGFGERIKYCDQQKQLSRTPELDKDKLASINANKRDVFIALSYLSIRNTFICESNSRYKFAFDYGVFIHFQKKFSEGSMLTKLLKAEGSGLPPSNAVELVYPSARQIGFSVRYSKLPKGLKSYVESVVGENVFDIFKAEKLNLLDLSKN